VPRPSAPVPPWRRAVSHVYTVFVICLVLAVAGVIGGVDSLIDVMARAWPFALGLAAFCAVFFIGGHYWPKLRLILYGAWLVAGAVLGVASGDENVIDALWGLALLGIFFAILYVLNREISRANVMLAVGAYLVMSVVLVAFGQIVLAVALSCFLMLSGMFIVLPVYVVKRLKRRRPASPPLAPRRLPG